MEVKDALQRANECRRAAARIYSKERGRRPMTSCLNETIAIAITRAWYDGYLVATETMEGLKDDNNTPHTDS